ncbi:MAG: AAA family ATPase [Candidatus Aminicenantes bacterium]|nr:AAA family ATPase [Candidatus Aminicenantes bacterium]
MINHFFGFTRKPFSKTIISEELFPGRDYQNLAERLKYFLTEGGIFLLTGSIGTGKTTALRRFAASINPNTHSVIYIAETFDRKRDFYRAMLSQCGIKPPYLTGDCKGMLKKHILDLHLTKRITPVFILDEAQNYPAFVLEEIRLLSNFDFDSSSPALFIIAGHRLLTQRINLHENEALRQRISLKFNLEGMSIEDTCAYISHRLEKSGSAGRIFADPVLVKIHEEAAGIPRMINTICNALLLSAVIAEKKIIDEHLFEQTRNEWR